MRGRRGDEGVMVVARRARTMRLSKKEMREKANEGGVVEVRVDPREPCGRKTMMSENESKACAGLRNVSQS